MRRQQRRPMHYHARSLYDGTVVAAFPVRKPAPKVIKRDNLKIDEDGVCIEDIHAGKHLSDFRDETRYRFQNIVSISLNTRRALREIVLPRLAVLQQEMESLRAQMDRIEQLLTAQPKG